MTWLLVLSTYVVEWLVRDPCGLVIASGSKRVWWIACGAPPNAVRKVLCDVLVERAGVWEWEVKSPHSIKRGAEIMSRGQRLRISHTREVEL